MSDTDTKPEPAKASAGELTTFTYAKMAPLQAITLKRAKPVEDGAEPQSELLDVTFAPGAEVKVPADHPVVRGMVSCGYLTEVDAATPADAGKNDPPKIPRTKTAKADAKKEAE